MMWGRLFGCFFLLLSTDALGADRAILTTTDFSSGSIAVVNLETNEATTNVLNIHSDAAVRTYGGKVYIVNRLGQDNILVLDRDNLQNPVLQFSVGNGTNPQDIALVSESKAYVSRLASASLLVVNPATGDSLSSIDLSAFADEDGFPEVAHLAVYRGQLYATCQRLVDFAPTDHSVIAVIDVATDQIVDLDSNLNGTQGITLATKNPFAQRHFYDKLYLSSVGSFSDLTDGGIEIVNLSTNQTEGVALSESDLGGSIGSLALLYGGVGYVVVSNENFVNGVKNIDLVNKKVGDSLSGLSGGFIPDIDILNGRLYVSDQGTFNNPGTAGFHIFSTATDALYAGPIATGLPPASIGFVTDGIANLTARADFSDNGKVDFNDFLIFVNAFDGEGSSFIPRLDLNDDGAISFDDFLLFAGVFGKSVRN